jgi:hypothetical protein
MLCMQWLGKLGNTYLRISKRLRVVLQLTSIDEPRGSLPEAEKMHRRQIRWSPPTSGLRASSVSFFAIVAVFFDLPVAVEPQTVRGGRVHVRKGSERWDGREMIYGVPSRYVPAYPLFSLRVLFFPRCSPTPAPPRTPKSSVPGEKPWKDEMSRRGGE